jgi:hypothetical protein
MGNFRDVAFRFRLLEHIADFKIDFLAHCGLLNYPVYLSLTRQIRRLFLRPYLTVQPGANRKKQQPEADDYLSAKTHFLSLC